MFLRHIVEDAPVELHAGRRREGGAARRTGPEELARAALARRAGAGDLSDGRTLNLPTGDRRVEPYETGEPLDFAPARGGRSTASPSRRRMWSPIRWPTAIRGLTPAIDWDATIRYRAHLWDLGLGVAEAMDTAQRGMGLGWPEAQELIAPRARRGEGRVPAR